MSHLTGRVLVVDDDELFLRVCTTLLRRAGLTVDAVPGPDAAVAAVGAHRYDAVVSDFQMPGGTGLALLKTLRTLDATVPFVLMTGAPTMESAISAIDLGVYKYIPKPFDVDRFVETVTEAIQKRVGAHDLPSLNRRLDRALEGMWMAYQPIVAFSQRRPHAYEALLRTSAPEVKGPPDVLDLAEKTGRLFDLGRAIRKAVAEAMPGLTPEVDVFVNMHPVDLDDPELYSPDAPLCAWAGRVVLEITERASIAHDKTFDQRMVALRALGYRIAVDDLGAGYAGLTTLARVVPEFVKLDGALVRDIDTSTVNQLVVGSVIELCRGLGARVVAEAIETTGELATLRALGVDLMQGYLFARPGRPFVAATFPEPAAAVAA